MTRHFGAAFPPAGAMLACLTACSSGANSSASSNVQSTHDAMRTTSAAVVNRPDSGTIQSAELALTRWLQASRERTKSESAAGAIGSSAAHNAGCDDDGAPSFPSNMLADFTLLPSEFRGDTIIGRAEVITVAEHDVDRRDPARFVARQRVQHAVLEWDVVPTDDGAWAVCNGLRFGYRGADSLTTWRPLGSSYHTAHALVDSILTARVTAHGTARVHPRGAGDTSLEVRP